MIYRVSFVVATVQRWYVGATPDLPARKREHRNRPTAWMKLAASLSYGTVRLVCAEEAFWEELRFFLDTVAEVGVEAARGACFCLSSVPALWPSQNESPAAFEFLRSQWSTSNRTVQDTAMEEAALEFTVVARHVAGRCLKCGAKGHYASQCKRGWTPQTEEEKREVEAAVKARRESREEKVREAFEKQKGWEAKLAKLQAARKKAESEAREKASAAAEAARKKEKEEREKKAQEKDARKKANASRRAESEQERKVEYERLHRKGQRKRTGDERRDRTGEYQEKTTGQKKNQVNKRRERRGVLRKRKQKQPVEKTVRKTASKTGRKPARKVAKK